MADGLKRGTRFCCLKQTNGKSLKDFLIHVTWGKTLTTPVTHDLGLGIKIHNQRKHQHFVSLSNSGVWTTPPSLSQHKGEAWRLGFTQVTHAKDINTFWHCLTPSWVDKYLPYPTWNEKPKEVIIPHFGLLKFLFKWQWVLSFHKQSKSSHRHSEFTTVITPLASSATRKRVYRVPMATICQENTGAWWHLLPVTSLWTQITYKAFLQLSLCARLCGCLFLTLRHSNWSRSHK